MKIGFVSDIHEDVVRLKEAISILKPCCDKLVCLGDILGYSIPYYGFLKTRNASECVRLVRKHCYMAVVGNHDLAAIKKIPRYSAGIPYPKNFYQLDMQTRTNLSRNMKIWSYENDLPAVIGKNEARFLKTLPEHIIANFGGVGVFISHYAYPDLAGNLALDTLAPADVAPQLRFQTKNDCMFGISGHDHTEGIQIFNRVKVRRIAFGVRAKVKSSCWITCPCVANGTFANGVAIFDSEKLEMTTIPLGTKKHQKPDWANL